MAIFVVPFTTLLNWDPFYYVFKLPYFPKTLSFVLFQYILRTSMLIVYWVTYSRTILLAVVFIFGLCECGLGCLQLQLKASKCVIMNCNYDNDRTNFQHNSNLIMKLAPWSWIRIVRSISNYRRFVLFFNLSVYQFAGNLISVGMALVTVVVVTSGFVTIRLYRVVPMPYYLLFPAIMVVFFVTVFMWFPYFVKLNDIFREVRKNWYGQLHLFPKQRRKLVVREVRSIKGGVVSVLIGDYVFSVFHRGTQTGCFKRLLDYLITACLSIPV
jgi:hypothetical protein